MQDILTEFAYEYPRRLQPLVEELLSEFRILYLTGPRQAGKSTLARAVAGRLGMEYITLDDRATLESAQSDPHGFIRSLGSRRVVLDEFQYAPGLIPAIKEASDKLLPGERGKFLLTGSADIFRSARTQEALPGHMARVTLFPLSLSEIATNNQLNIIDYLLEGDFQRVSAPFVSRDALAERVLRGGYPEVQGKSSRARRAWFDSYLEGRLFKDFETLYAARGDYHSKLRAMAPYLAGLSGNLLKYANVANDLELNDKLVKNYVEVLELMFILRRVPAYLKNRAKRLAVRMPKVHYVDTGLACHLLGIHSGEQLLRTRYYGSLLESLVCMECCKQAAWACEPTSVYQFRNNRQREVDIVLERDGARIIGMEIKASASIGSKDFQGLVALAEYAGDAFERGVIFYTGKDVLPFRQGGLTFHALPIGLLMDGASGLTGT